jgi:hypothetical protein
MPCSRQSKITTGLPVIHPQAPANDGELRVGGVTCTSATSLLLHVLVEEGEHIGLPNVHAEMEKVVPIVHCMTDRRIDL